MPSIIKNTVNLLKAYIYQKIVALFYFILLSRYLGPANLGKYTFALYFIAIFSTLMDFGTTGVLTREISRYREKTKEYINTIVSFKIISGVLVYLFAFILINILNYPLITRYLVYLAGVVMILDSFSLTLYQAFRAYFNLKYESIGIIIQKTLVLISGITLIILKAPLILMMFPLIFGSIFYFLNAIFFIRKKLKFFPFLNFDFPVLKKILRISLTFFVIAIFIQLFMTMNTILLSKLAGDKFVGYYTAAERIPLALVALFANPLTISIYPVFSRFFIKDREKIKPLLEKSIFYLFTFSSFLAVILFFLAKPAIAVIYKSTYFPSIVVLKILVICLPFMYLNNILTAFLNACNKQKLNVFSYSIALIFLIVTNAFLTPIFKQNGAAFALLIGYLALSSFQLYYVKKLVGFSKSYLKKRIVPVIFLTLISGSFIYFLISQINYILAVSLGILLYIFLGYLFKIVKKEEIISIKNSISLKF